MNLPERTEKIYWLLHKFEQVHGWEIPERRELAKFLAAHIKSDGLEKPKTDRSDDPSRVK